MRLSVKSDVNVNWLFEELEELELCGLWVGVLGELFEEITL